MDGPGPELEYNIIKQGTSSTWPRQNPRQNNHGNGSLVLFRLFCFITVQAEIPCHSTLPLTSSYITTDDTLAAFVCQSIARARLPTLR